MTRYDGRSASAPADPDWPGEHKGSAQKRPEAADTVVARRYR
jgi:hypothetical protein